MDSQLTGIILNCTLKAYKFTPMERVNMLHSTMDFCRGSRVLVTGGETASGNKSPWFNTYPRLVPVPVRSLVVSSYDAKPSVPVPPTSMVKAAKIALQEVSELRDEILLLCNQCDQLRCKIHKA